MVILSPSLSSSCLLTDNGKWTHQLWPNYEPGCARKFRCANRVLQTLFVPSSSCKGRRRRTETRSKLNPVHRSCCKSAAHTATVKGVIIRPNYAVKEWANCRTLCMLNDRISCSSCISFEIHFLKKWRKVGNYSSDLKSSIRMKHSIAEISQCICRLWLICIK